MDIIKNGQEIVTPAYYYDLSLLRTNASLAKKESEKYGYHIHYAIKANHNKRIVKELVAMGFGADCVSGQEIELAIACGFDAEKIVFAGVGKTDKEIQIGLEHQIMAFNVESLQELEVLADWAQRLKRKASVALRINPNVDAKTHHYITTGLEENKFGIPSSELERCIQCVLEHPFLEFKGLHFHVGSQITELHVFKRLCQKVNEWNRWFLERGIAVPILNLGGGLGVNYEEPDTKPFADFESFFKIFHDHLEPQAGQEIHFELGRSLVASCGVLLGRVLYVKEGLDKKFAILDAGMTELLRPALYQAYHQISVIEPKPNSPKYSYDVVGPICESSDCFGKHVLLPELERGMLVGIHTAGAYGEVMASRYNLRQELHFYFKD